MHANPRRTTFIADRKDPSQRELADAYLSRHGQTLVQGWQLGFPARTSRFRRMAARTGDIPRELLATCQTPHRSGPARMVTRARLLAKAALRLCYSVETDGSRSVPDRSRPLTRQFRAAATFEVRVANQGAVMNASIASGCNEGQYELRFRSLFVEGRGYAFPCDRRGMVVLNSMSEPARCNYFYARAMVGREFGTPEVLIH